MWEAVSGTWYLLVIIGITAGVLGSALGVGGGIVFVPSLVLLCAFPQKSAQGTSLAVMIPMAMLAAFRYWRNPAIEINATAVCLLAAGVVAGALIGSELAGILPAKTLRTIFAVFVMIAAIRMLLPGRSETRDIVSTQQTPAGTDEKGEQDYAYR